MNEKRKKETSYKRYNVAYIIIYVILIALYGLIWYRYVDICKDAHKQYNTIKNGVIVEAEFVRIESFIRSSDSARTRKSKIGYDLIYEYVDGDIKYEGEGAFNFDYESEAEKYLGEKIQIYIDGKGVSIPVGQQPNILPAVFMSIFVVLYFIVFVLWPFTGKKIMKFFLNYKSD